MLLDDTSLSIVKNGVFSETILFKLVMLLKFLRDGTTNIIRLGCLPLHYYFKILLAILLF